MVFFLQYVYNRRGYCKIIFLYYRNAKDCFYVRYKVYFDTSIKSKHILPAYKAMYPNMRMRCPTMDMDPLANCCPVNCLIKYSGCKSYYDQDAQLCTSVNTCAYDAEDRPIVSVHLHNGWLTRRNSQYYSSAKQFQFIPKHIFAICLQSSFYLFSVEMNITE